jgi:hypothetical protein
MSRAGLVAALTLPIATSPAAADSTRSESCIVVGGTLSCVTRWRHHEGAPKPPTEQELTEVRERERRWEAYCRPYVWQDEFGVRRYGYTERGCEYGRLY